MISNKYNHLRLEVLDENFEYVLFDSAEQMNRALVSLNGRMADFIAFSFKGERSLICFERDLIFEFTKSEKDWVGIKIEGEMPFGTVQGLISSISNPLAKNGIGVCVVSTYLTDLFLVKKSNIEKSKIILKSAGWEFKK
jgi:uncharacterized protein